MNLHLMILLLASRLSLNAGLNDLEKQVAAFKIQLDKQGAELKQLKRINEFQNEKISLLNKANEDLQQQLQNQSSMIDDLQNQQEQLQNSTYQQGDEAVTKLDGGGYQQEIYQLLNTSNNQQIQIDYLMDQRKELRKTDIIIQQMIQDEIQAVNLKFLNITDNQFDQITNLTKQNERLQDIIELDTNKGNNLITALNKSIDRQKNEIMKIKSVIDYSKCTVHNVTVTVLCV